MIPTNTSKEFVGWLIPEDKLSQTASDTFLEIMRVISRGGTVDVHARVDGQDYRWECDGLKYAAPLYQDCKESGQ